MIFGTDPFPTLFDVGAATTKLATYAVAGDVKATGTETYTFSGKIKAVIAKNYRMGGRVGIEPPSYQMAGYIVYDANDPRLTSSIIDAFWWCYAKQYNALAQSVDLMRYRLKLDYASSDDLDDYWGKVLNVRRRATETDADYRARLATHIRIITSSGTKQNIEAVIDRIIGVTGGTECETVGFATVRLKWNSGDAILAAEASDALITETMDRTVACGVSWSTAYPYAKYYMSPGYRCYETTATYGMESAISKLRGYNYHMTGGLWESGDWTYDMEGSIGVIHSATYRQIGRTIATGMATYMMAGRLNSYVGYSKTAEYNMAGYANDVMRRYYSMAGVLEAT